MKTQVHGLTRTRILRARDHTQMLSPKKATKYASLGECVRSHRERQGVATQGDLAALLGGRYLATSNG